MLRWLTDKYRRWRRAKSRHVFRFFDGTRTRAVDPYTVYVQLETHNKFKWSLSEDIQDGDWGATEVAVDATSEVFGVPRFRDDPQGLTDGEMVELLVSFTLYMAAAKKKYDRLLTLLPPTDGVSSNVPMSTRTGNCSSGFGSAYPAPTSDTPSTSSVA